MSTFAWGGVGPGRHAGRVRRHDIGWPLCFPQPLMLAKDPSSGGAASSSAAAMLNQPIVIDCGSASMEAGYAGGTKPKVRRRAWA